jgi:ABC-type transport system substrate-binding protein
MGATAVGITTLGGCAGKPPAPTGAPTLGGATAAASGATGAPAQPKRGGNYVEGDPGDAVHLDPHLTAASIQFTGRGPGNAYGRLLTFNATSSRKGAELAAYGELAESWQQVDDTTYTFKLRPGVKWQNIAPVNGRPVTAQDVAYSYDRQKTFRANAGGLSTLEKAEAVDNTTLKLTLAKPDADFLESLAGSANVIVAHEAVDLKGDLKQGPTIGFGPWILDKWEKDSLTVLMRNPDYHVPGIPYLDSLTYRRLGDEQTRIAAFRTGELSFSPTGVGRLQLEDIKRGAIPNLQVAQDKLLGVGVEMVFQTTRKPFDDVRVRRALSMGIDRQDLINRVQKKYGDAYWMVGPYVPDESWLLPDDEVKRQLRYDPEGAKRLLAEAGYPNGLSVEIHNLIYNDQFSEPAEAAVAQLKRVGVNATLKKVDTGAWITNVLFGAQFDVYIGPIYPAQPLNTDLAVKYRSGGSRWASRYQDDKLDRMIDAQAVLRDAAQRKQAVLDLQRYLAETLPVIALYGLINFSAYQPYVRGYQPFLGGGEWAHLNYIWFDK